jgi:hypothetical protein
MSYKVVLTHINNIEVGDTVEIDGELKTVGKDDIKSDSFLGRTLFGDCFSLGYEPVRKVIFPNQPKKVAKPSSFKRIVHRLN